MIRFLSRLFIPNRENIAEARVRRAYGMLCGAVGIALNVVLFAAKAFAGAMTHSIAVTADAFNNLSDAGLGSLITLFGFKIAGARPTASILSATAGRSMSRVSSWPRHHSDGI